jgi:hypothetical protein
VNDEPTAPTPPHEKKKPKYKAITPCEPPPGKLVLNARESMWLTGLSYYDLRKLAILRELPVIEFPTPEALRKRKDRPRSRSRTRKRSEAMRRLLFARSDIENFIARCRRVG